MESMKTKTDFENSPFFSKTSPVKHCVCQGSHSTNVSMKASAGSAHERRPHSNWISNDLRRFFAAFNKRPAKRVSKMTVMEFFGCSLIAFGPPFSMFCLTVCKDPIRIIILISAAFFWLLSLLFSSVLWFAIVPLRNILIFGVIFSVIFQESFRYLFYRLLREAEAGLQKVSEVGMDTPTVVANRVTLAYVAGLGFGIMSGAFSLVNVLADAIGPGTVGIKGDSPNFFLVSAFTTLAFILLHTFWGIIFFQCLDSKNYFFFSYVIVSHMFVSCLTLFNLRQYYAASLIPIYIITVLTACVAFKSAGGSVSNVKQTFSLRRN